VEGVDDDRLLDADTPAELAAAGRSERPEHRAQRSPDGRS